MGRRPSAAHGRFVSADIQAAQHFHILKINELNVPLNCKNINVVTLSNLQIQRFGFGLHEPSCGSIEGNGHLGLSVHPGTLPWARHGAGVKINALFLLRPHIWPFCV